MRRLVPALILLGIASLIGLEARAQPAGVSVAAVAPTHVLYMPLISKPPTLTPTDVPTPTTAPTLTPTQVPVPLPGIANGGFEQGHIGWVEIPGNAIITQFGPVPPRTGQWAAWLGGEVGGVDEIQQQVTLPQGAPLWLHYAYRPDPEDYSLSSRLDILIGATLIDADYMFPVEGWLLPQVDVSAYAGQTVTLRFRLTEGPRYAGGAAVDDVFLSR